uniref:RRM domain-containing protein n=1 Tax=Opuntia streptacantha TaxID=393608 RepID=A0A7C8ZJ78_OPUST
MPFEMTESMDMESEVVIPQSPEEIKPSENGEDETSLNAVSSNSDAESDSESDDEAHDVLQMQTLAAELFRNPSNYNAHVQYIRLLRRAGEIDKLRQARESMSQLFPLTPSMWQEWAKDETTLSSGPEAVLDIEKLYERGVSDYLSVSLWCDYLNFVQEHDPSVSDCSAAGIAKARNLFERALTAAGLHFAEGSRIWEAYREFEQAVCLTIDESDIKAKEKQIQHIRSIFHRHLSVPLNDMNSTLLAYKAWEAEQGNDLDVNSGDLKGVASHALYAYKKALEMQNARVNLEEQISKPDLPDSERIPLFKRYLKFEESLGDPSRVQILYERAVTEFPLSSDLWMDYTRYMDKTIKVGNVLKVICNRATRNCPWLGELWVRYLLCLERGHASEEEVSLVFERALQCTFSSYEEYLDLFLTRVDGLRRRMSLAGEIQVLDYAVIRDVFQRASDYLSAHLKGTYALLHLHEYWARLELSLSKDIVAARGVWENLLKISGSMLEAWKGYIAMEIENGNLNEARSLYRRCYTKRFPGRGSEDLCQSWLRFEREFGTLEDYDHAVQKVSPRLEELHMFSLQQESKAVATSGEAKEHSYQKSSCEKRKPSSNLSEDQTPPKRQKEKRKSYKKGSKKDHDKEQDVSGTNKTEETETNFDKRENSNVKLKKDSMNEKAKYTDQCTAFISNLSLTANYEHLRNFFSDVGGVQSVRILKDKYTGKSRGLAYVDFCDDAHLKAALAKNKEVLLGKKLSIARSDPTQSKKRGSGGRFSTDKEGGQNLPESTRDSTDQCSSKRPESKGIQLKGKNTFAVPRNVRPLGWTAEKPKAAESGEDEKPKSNDEFRQMLLKK